MASKNSAAEAKPGPLVGHYALSHWLLLRLLGAVHLLAFLSLHAQVRGLFGSDGVLPLAPRVLRLSERLGPDAWQSAPSLFLFTGASDIALSLCCVAGELASLALMCGVLGGPAALVCFALYLSFVSVGTPFLPLQWDTLLLEATLLAAISSPWTRLVCLPREAQAPTPLARYAFVFLLARLVFASGLVKLLSGDAAWAELEAMSVHYETQPLPGPLSPFMHRLPLWWHRVETALVLLLELTLPLLLLAPPRRVRLIGAAGIAALMALIFLTGNYGFFNLLTAALCLASVDDAALHALLPRRARARLQPRALQPPPSATRAALPSAAAIVMMVLGATQLAWTCGLRPEGRYEALLQRALPFRLASSYGLFAVMTMERPELVIEGSRDGHTWEAYELRYKPGDLMRGPMQVAPHMPRLDWMLWFAALGDPEGVPWVFELERALLEGSPAALALFARDPFAGEPPRFIRARRYRYHFAPAGDDAAWTRELEEPFGPTLSAP